MPDFDARMISGGTPTIWIDPAIASAPSRLNNYAAHQPRYLKVAPGATVVLKATVGGVEGPADAALGGRLFQAWFAEWSGPYPPSLVQTSGSSSIVTITLTAAHLGHFLFCFGREGGGTVCIPFEVEA